MKDSCQFTVASCQLRRTRPHWLAIAVCGGLLTASASARAATYYVTVAGLGGEPDYDQRFTANAMDLDKIFKSGAGAHVYTLTGKQSTKARLTETLTQMARDARPEDDLVVTLIGHGSSVGTNYSLIWSGRM